MARRKGSAALDDPMASELSDIKRLLILQLITSGVEAQHIARALGTSKSTLSRLVPARAVGRTKTRLHG